MEIKLFALLALELLSVNFAARITEKDNRDSCDSDDDCGDGYKCLLYGNCDVGDCAYKCDLVCAKEIPTFSNGSASGSTLRGGYLTITCEAGFEPLASSVVACSLDGTWSGGIGCQRRDCGTVLPTILNGNAALDGGTLFQDIATVTCNTGYNPSQASIMCQDTGIWEDATCIPISCGAKPTISDGSTTLAVTGADDFLNAVMVTCNTGYTTTDTTLHCQSDASWETTTCDIVDCGSTPSIDYGSLDPDSGTEYQDTATVNCDAGYVPSQASIMCQGNGQWECGHCSQKQECGVFPTIANSASIELAVTDADEYESVAIVTCDTGYSAASSFIECQSDATWSTTTCDIIDCGLVPSIDAGSLDASSGTTYNSVATLTCDDGYDPSQSTSTCLPSGLWETVTCVVRQCGSLPAIANSASIDLAVAGANYVANVATVTCNQGYQASNFVLECLKSGQWSTETCDIVQCGEAPDPEFGSVAGTGSYGDSLSVVCDTGYIATAATVLCQADGTWTLTECILKTCGDFPSIANANRIELAVPEADEYENIAIVTCDTGYSAASSFIECQADATWSTTTCDIIDCGPVPLVDAGSLDASSGTSFNSVATLSCDDGYDPSQSTSTCLPNGLWETVTCILRQCGSFPTIANTVSIELAVAGANYVSNMATVTCNTGYEASNCDLECLKSGQWSTETCDIVQCGEAPDPEFGTVAGTGSYGDSLSVVCDTGYIATASTVTCQADGTWSLTECIPKTCDTQPTVPSGSVSQAVAGANTYQTVLLVTCDPGYEADDYLLACQSDGTYETTTCTKKDCGDVLPEISNGTITPATTGATKFGDLANVVCDPGFEKSTSTIICQADGTWDSTAVCNPVDCGPLVVEGGNVYYGYNEYTVYPAKAFVKCTDDNTLASVSSCKTNGEWTAVACGAKFECTTTNCAACDNRFYLVTNAEADFDENLNFCQQVGMEAIKYNSCIRSHLQNILTSGKYYWTAASDRTTEGTFIFETDNSVFDPNFAEGENGANAENEDCIAFDPDELNDFYDFECSAKATIICVNPTPN